MKSYFALYNKSKETDPVDSTVLVFDKNLSIGFRNTDGNNAMINWLLKDIEVTFDFPSHCTKLRNVKFPDSYLLIEGNEALNFIKELKNEQQKVWYKKSSGKEWIRNAFILGVIIGLLILLYLLIVPWLSEKLVSKVSLNTEQQLGDSVYDAMGLTEKEDISASYTVNQFFSEMNITTSYNIKITVVEENVENAFALPGGRIVVYKALLKKIKSYPELAALLGHEFTHINNKHATRSIFRRLGSKVFLSLLFGKFGTLTSVLADHADDLKSLTYSRKLEKEADMNGLQILEERKIDPRGFIDLLIHLKESASGSTLPEFLGSHPDIDKRIGYIKEASKNSTIIENDKLKYIFEKLK